MNEKCKIKLKTDVQKKKNKRKRFSCKRKSVYK